MKTVRSRSMAPRLSSRAATRRLTLRRVVARTRAGRGKGPTLHHLLPTGRGRGPRGQDRTRAALIRVAPATMTPQASTSTPLGRRPVARARRISVVTGTRLK